MNDRERRNLVIFQPGGSAEHVESFFIKVNNPAAGYGLWIKFTILGSKSPARGAIAGVWATRVVHGEPERNIGIRNSLPLEHCRFDKNRAGLRVGGAVFAPGLTRGTLRDGLGREIAWDIQFNTGGEALFLFPRSWMYTASLPRFKTATPYADARASGFFRVGKERWDFEDLPCMQGHNWGVSHSPHYAWAHCNAFDDSPGSVFEGLSAKVGIGGFRTPFLSLAVLKHEGVIHRFDGAKTLLTRRVSMNRQSWGFTFRNDEHELTGIIMAHRHDFTGLMYPNPDFTHRLCVNSQVAGATMELIRIRDGERIAKLISTRGAMLELVSPETWPDVCIHIPPFDPEATESGALI